MRDSESVRKGLENNGLFHAHDRRMLSHLRIKAGRPRKNRRLDTTGYTQYSVLNGDGEMDHLEYVYTGNHYRQALSGRKRVCVRAAYATLMACTIALFFSSAYIAPLNTVWYVTIPQAVCLPCFAWLVKNIFCSIWSTARDLEEREYRTVHGGIRKASAGAAIACCAELIGVAVFVLIHGISDEMIEMLCALKYLLCAAMMFAVFHMESAIRYDVIKNNADIPENYVKME